MEPEKKTPISLADALQPVRSINRGAAPSADILSKMSYTELLALRKSMGSQPAQVVVDQFLQQALAREKPLSLANSVPSAGKGANRQGGQDTDISLANARVPGLRDHTDPSVIGWAKHLLSLPKQADDAAEAEFPDSARDSSVKNSYRHALGTGLLAQELGANEGGVRGAVAQGLAKAAGYGWEALGYATDPAHAKDKAYNTDTKHDLNSNAVGAKQAGLSATREELARRLKAMALQSPPVEAPGFFESSPGYLSRTER